MAENNALAVRNDKIKALIESRKERIMSLLPAQIGMERFKELILTIVSRPEIADCTPASIIDCVYGCAKLGLMPDPIIGHVYIVPRSSKRNDSWTKEAKIQIGYKGYIELGRRSGTIRSVNTDIIYDCDKFEYWADEHGKHYKHIPNLNRGEDARPIAVYCSAEMSGDTAPQVEVIPWSDIMAVRERYADKKSMAWNEAISQLAMAKKTAVRQCARLWPQSPELARAVTWDEAGERGERQQTTDDVVVESIEVANQPKKSLKDLAESIPQFVDDNPPIEVTQQTAESTVGVTEVVAPLPNEVANTPEMSVAAPIEQKPVDSRSEADINTENEAIQFSERFQKIEDAKAWIIGRPRNLYPLINQAKEAYGIKKGVDPTLEQIQSVIVAVATEILKTGGKL